MKLEKAIEILSDVSHSSYLKFGPDFPDALKLGIEALKAVKECRASNMLCPGLTMPGETPENGPTRSLHHIKAVLESPLGKEPKTP